MYKKAHPDKLGTDVTDEVIKIWKNTLEKEKVIHCTRSIWLALIERLKGIHETTLRLAFFTCI